MASLTLISTLLLLLLTCSARASRLFTSRPKNTRQDNKGKKSFSVPVYHRQRYNKDRKPSTFTPSKVYTYSHANHEDLLVMPVGIGTSSNHALLLTTELVIDTGSNLFWLQAQPCKHCYDQGHFPYYNTSASTTYRPIYCKDWMCGTIPAANRPCHDLRWDAHEPCSYTAKYADNTNSSGVIGTETFYFESLSSEPGSWNGSVEDMPFGLGSSNYLPDNLAYKHSAPGIAGLMRGHGSLLGKLGVSKFSHCFPRYKDFLGVLRFGDDAVIAGEKVALIKNTRFYAARLTNIYVSGKRVRVHDLPSEMIFDTGASISQLAPRTMDAVVASVKSALGEYRAHRWKDYELCYDLIEVCSISLDEVAKMTLEFDYSSKIDLFSFQVWVRDIDHKEICLGFHRANSDRNIFGNNLMKAVNIGYSLDEDELAMYFDRQPCVDID